jgi:hypothetical protein
MDCVEPKRATFLEGRLGRRRDEAPGEAKTGLGPRRGEAERDQRLISLEWEFHGLHGTSGKRQRGRAKANVRTTFTYGNLAERSAHEAERSD